MSSDPPDHQGQDGLLPPPRPSRERVGSAASVTSNRNQSYFSPSVGAPGAFSTDLKQTIISRTDPFRPERNDSFRPPPTRPDLQSVSSWSLARHTDARDDKAASEARQAHYRDRIERENKIRAGSENLLEALNSKNPKHTKEQRLRVESELDTSNRKIAQLKGELAEEIRKANEVPPPIQSRLSQLFKSSARSPSRVDGPDHEDGHESEDEHESPTYALAELLQALEAEGLAPDYYAEKANNLVELFKRHPTLKYDLVWSIFGSRVQSMLLSDNREVIAAGFRVMRYAITDRNSLEIMRSFHTDDMVILSLVKDAKVSIEREQALKFVRAFLDVKDGVKEISKSIVRTIVAVAEHHDDRLRNICILTLAELLIRDPALAASAGVIGILADALADGTYHPAESLVGAFLFLLDTPWGRKYLKSGHEVEGALATFTDGTSHFSEDHLKSSAKVVAVLLKTWPGFMTLSTNNFVALRSLTTSLYLPSSDTRNVVLELILDILKIKAPSWSPSFLAGRRLTTYGRVANVQITESTRSKGTSDPSERQELVEHFVAILLAALLHAGLLDALLYTIREESHQPVKRKATLLLGEVLNMAARVLPSEWSAKMQTLPGLFTAASQLSDDNRDVAMNAIYQIDSVSRTLNRTAGQKSVSTEVTSGHSRALRSTSDAKQDAFSPQVDEATFRAVILETQVLSTANFAKWRWDIIEKVIDGPLANPKRLDEAIKASKFIHRIAKFYRPFEYRFSDVLNSKPNQRYVRVGCALMRTLLGHPEGIRYLAENKLLRQLAECLAQVDRLSGLTSNSPLFAADRLLETLSGGYFALLGTLSSSAVGLAMMERWKMANMFYHIVELEDRDDLIKALLSNMDYALDSHLRVVLSKGLTSCSTTMRVFSTRLLRRYATRKEIEPFKTKPDAACAEWAIDLLVTQLYDPDVEVCEMAVKILEEACNEPASLEYVVRCRPALDHLGEIGAPVLLRFLSTSIGYHYLDGLDYISQEMDDWFLGRNDSYAMIVEASLAKALLSNPEKAVHQTDEAIDGLLVHGAAPPHFYRELTRTAEGCKLLEEKKHFEEFVSVIHTHGMESQEAETMLKVKGCLWAVGNIGSMELGAPFLVSSDVVQTIVQIAERSGAMTMRGTAVMVLGLISRSVHGQEILAEQGWEVAVDEMGESAGICLPRDFARVFSMRSLPGPADPLAGPGEEGTQGREKITDEDAVNARILELVNDLSNTVLSKARAAELHSIKAKRAAGFRSPAMFAKVRKLLERHHFRLPVLRFVMDLFDKEGEGLCGWAKQPYPGERKGESRLRHAPGVRQQPRREMNEAKLRVPCAAKRLEGEQMARIRSGSQRMISPHRRYLGASEVQAPWGGRRRCLSANRASPQALALLITDPLGTFKPVTISREPTGSVCSLPHAPDHPASDYEQKRSDLIRGRTLLFRDILSLVDIITAVPRASPHHRQTT
ncbi:hypothetical protein FH972_021750 [Carpinus fangiana]|uniref:REM-1 domain-containing protein n=1 Tax=Carpinus fangiana TaxID=176857 RepID=A0A5N6KQ76_9ROSI|nr:hypothetical protein FH972_021750 [Carpinus fangiana]